MNTHEYQAKIVLRKYGIPIPEFVIVSNMSEVQDAIAEMGLEKAVLKVQVHAGGRGKAGGVKLVQSPEEILEQAEKMLQMCIINNQTGLEGVVAYQLMISPLIDYVKEYYIGAIIDRQEGQAVLIVSPEGGMDIEDIAAKFPHRLLKTPIPLTGKLRSYQLTQIGKFMGWKGKILEQGKTILSSLAKAFVETDASLLEINPLVETTEGFLLALDAKLSIDDNALFRQPFLQGFYDPTQVTKYEAQAKDFDLAYVALNGEIGCMVNGAGLAMATMDIIHHYGGNPANFLDVGGGASQEKVAEGFKIILSDPKVKAIFVNIFGGIMNCATLASGIVAAARELQPRVPIVVRMEGTNVEEGKEILAHSGLKIEVVDSFSGAAQQVVALSKRA